jgi:hypothetical protein
MVRKLGSAKSAKRKPARATKHLKAIKICIAEYSGSRPYKITSGETDGKKTKHIRILKAPPDALGPRSLAFGLVERNVKRAALPARWEERSQFPLAVKIPNGKTR